MKAWMSSEPHSGLLNMDPPPASPVGALEPIQLTHPQYLFFDILVAFHPVPEQCGIQQMT